MSGALEWAGLLDCLVTSWCFSASGRQWVDRLGFCPNWVRRPAAPVCISRVRRVWWAELRRIAGQFAGKNHFENGDAAFAKIDQSAAHLVSSRTDGVLAREDCCLASFRRAEQYGKPRIYLMPTAHYVAVQRLMQNEAQEFSEAFRPAEVARDFAPERVARKEEELKRASFVLCPSTFVLESMQDAGVEPGRIVLMPFGASAPTLGNASKLNRDDIFLYAGQISARKGVHRVIRVWKRLGAYRTHRLRLVGEMDLPQRFVAEYKGIFEHMPRMARESLWVEYCKAQAFVFNAMADGYGHVFAEAMACGTPVLASRNCGAPDLLRDGVDGRLFDYGDDDGLAAALEWALTHPSELTEMGAAARERARQWSWEDFAVRFLDWIGGAILSR